MYCYTGLPHSDTRGSQCLGHSPQLFAALRVLLRLQEPRHPPYALLLDLLLKGSLCLPVGRPELLLTFDGPPAGPVADLRVAHLLSRLCAPAKRLLAEPLSKRQLALRFLSLLSKNFPASYSLADGDPTGPFASC